MQQTLVMRNLSYFSLHSERHGSLQIWVHFSSLGESRFGLPEKQHGFRATWPSCVTFKSHDLVEEVGVAEADDHCNVAVKAWAGEDVGRHQEDVTVAENGQHIAHRLGWSFFGEHGVSVDVQFLGDRLCRRNASGNDQNSAESAFVAGRDINWRLQL